MEEGDKSLADDPEPVEAMETTPPTTQPEVTTPPTTQPEGVPENLNVGDEQATEETNAKDTTLISNDTESGTDVVPMVTGEEKEQTDRTAEKAAGDGVKDMEATSTTVSEQIDSKECLPTKQPLDTSSGPSSAPSKQPLDSSGPPNAQSEQPLDNSGLPTTPSKQSLDSSNPPSAPYQQLAVSEVIPDPPSPSSVPVLVPFTKDDLITVETSAENRVDEDLSLVVHIDESQMDIDNDLLDTPARSPETDAISDKPDGNTTLTGGDQGDGSPDQGDRSPVVEDSTSTKETKGDAAPATSTIFDLDSSSSEQDGPPGEKDNSSEAKPDVKDAKAKDIPTNSRNLWISGLASTTKANELKTLFSKHGKVAGAKVVMNAKSAGSKCYGFVSMITAEAASKCIQHLHRTEFHGKMISIERTRTDPTVKVTPKAAAAQKPDAGGRDRRDVDRRDRRDSSGSRRLSGRDHDRNRAHNRRASGPSRPYPRRSPLHRGPGRRSPGRRSPGRRSPGRRSPGNAASGKETDKEKKEVSEGDTTGGKNDKDTEEKEKDTEEKEKDTEEKEKDTEENEKDTKVKREKDTEEKRAKDRLDLEKRRAERDRERLRLREREMRENERRSMRDLERMRHQQQQVEMQQKEASMRLEREKQALRFEQQKLERERLEAERERIELERERQRRERERLEHEREQERQQQLRVEQERRAIKRTLESRGPSGRDTEYWSDPKRPTLDRKAGYEGTKPGADGRRVERYDRRDGQSVGAAPMRASDDQFKGRQNESRRPSGGPGRQQNGPPQQSGGPPRQQAGPSPRQQSGPSPRQQSGPSPRQQSGPSPRQQSGPSPRQQSGPSPQQQSGPIARQQSGSSARQQSGPSPRQQRDPSPRQQSGPSIRQQGGPPRVNRDERVRLTADERKHSERFPERRDGPVRNGRPPARTSPPQNHERPRHDRDRSPQGSRQDRDRSPQGSRHDRDRSPQGSRQNRDRSPQESRQQSNTLVHQAPTRTSPAYKQTRTSPTYKQPSPPHVSPSHRQQNTRNEWKSERASISGRDGRDRGAAGARPAQTTDRGGYAETRNTDTWHANRSSNPPAQTERGKPSYNAGPGLLGAKVGIPQVQDLQHQWSSDRGPVAGSALMSGRSADYSWAAVPGQTTDRIAVRPQPIAAQQGLIKTPSSSAAFLASAANIMMSVGLANTRGATQDTRYDAYKTLQGENVRRY